MVTSSPGAKPAPEARKRSPRRETSSNTTVHGPSRAVMGRGITLANADTVRSADTSATPQAAPGGLGPGSDTLSSNPRGRPAPAGSLDTSAPDSSTRKPAATS